jgi:hypothetical protein
LSDITTKEEIMSKILDVSEAQELITALEYKRRVCVERGTALASDRTALSFEAHTGKPRRRSGLLRYMTPSPATGAN